MPAGRTLWAGLHLLDRQVVDRDDVPTAKVDDLEFTDPADPEGLPLLTSILCGQAALARRFHPRLARAFELLRRVVEPVAEPGPARIPWSAVTEVGTHVKLAKAGDELPVKAVEVALAQVLGHLPGGKGQTCG